MIPRPMMTRPPGRRTARIDPHEPRLESLAAEFALLAQRRARLEHQVGLLQQQHRAAANTLGRLQTRMIWLAHRMHIRDEDAHSASFSKLVPVAIVQPPTATPTRIAASNVDVGRDSARPHANAVVNPAEAVSDRLGKRAHKSFLAPVSIKARHASRVWRS